MIKLNWNKKIGNLLKQQKTILLIGIKILATLMLLNSCKKIEYIYKEPIKEPITCINNIKTPLDMAKCLNEYKVKY